MLPSIKLLAEPRRSIVAISNVIIVNDKVSIVSIAIIRWPATAFIGLWATLAFKSAISTRGLWHIVRAATNVIGLSKVVSRTHLRCPIEPFWMQFQISARYLFGRPFLGIGPGDFVANAIVANLTMTTTDPIFEVDVISIASLVDVILSIIGFQLILRKFVLRFQHMGDRSTQFSQGAWFLWLGSLS